MNQDLHYSHLFQWCTVHLGEWKDRKTTTIYILTELNSGPLYHILSTHPAMHLTSNKCFLDTFW